MQDKIDILKKLKILCAYCPESVNFSPGSHFLRLISKLKVVDVPFESLESFNVSNLFLTTVPDCFGSFISGMYLGLVLLELDGLFRSMASEKNLSL